MAVEELVIKDIGEYAYPVYPESSGMPDWMAWADVSLFVLLLLVSAWLVWRPAGRGRWLWAVQLAAVGWFGFFRMGCLCPVGSVGNVAVSLFHPAVLLSVLAVVWFVLPLVAAFVMGRVFCAGLCPLGAVQDAVGWNARRVRSRVGSRLEKAFSMGTWLVLLYVLWCAFDSQSLPVCRYDPFVAFFRMAASPVMWVVSGCFLVFCLVVSRPFCRWLCPYGALLGLASRFAWRKRVIDPGTCLQCRKCEKCCPMNCIDRGRIDVSRCVLCGRCVRGCSRGSVADTADADAVLAHEPRVRGKKSRERV